MQGVGVDLGKELGARLGVPFKTVEFERVRKAAADAKSGLVKRVANKAGVRDTINAE